MYSPVWSAVRNSRWAVWVLAFSVLIMSATLWAQNGPAPAVGGAPAAAAAPTDPAATAALPRLSLNPETGELPTLVQLFNTSPIINGLIGGLSVVALLMFLYFMFTVNTGSMLPATFVDDVTKLVVARQYDQASQFCRNHRSVFVASIIQRCTENAGKEHSVILDMIDTEGRRRADVIWNRLSYLADVANVAPMLGLLGTVTGMMQAFFVLPTQSASINSKALSQAIGGAMATTFFGLIVAILALFFYSVIKSRTTRVLSEAEQVVHSIADHIKRGGE